MKRTRVAVRWLKSEGMWVVLRNGDVGRPGTFNDLGIIPRSATKAETITFARGLAHHHEPSQLIVKNKNGRIAFEHTYPRSSDPRRHKG